jgi:pimeloyl-ACP methyl ester carboxylesterase
MQVPSRRRIVMASALAAVLFTPGCAWIDERQRRVALRPTPGRPADADDPARWRPGDQRFLQPSVTAAGESLALWWLPQPDPGAPALLYLHGTLRNLYGNQPKIDALRDAGFAVLAVDYRGWGESTPIVPDEASIVADAWQAFDELKRRQPDARRRAIFGHSMGGAVAVALAAELHRGRDYGALALESTFTRLPDVAEAAGFWGRLGARITTLSFDSLSRIGRVDAPILMLHGDADLTVPVALGRRLRDAAPPGVTWIEVPGGSHSRLHNDAPALYRSTYQRLAASLAAS